MAAFAPFDAGRPIIGMVHLPALPGAPGYGGDRGAIEDAATADATALEAGGVDAVLVENYGDVPYLPGRVPRHTVASMTALVGAVTDVVELPVGVNVLQSDGRSAVAVAAAAGASFVRVNVHVGARVADSGLVEGDAHGVARLRERLDADVRVLADVDPKHSAALDDATVAHGVADAVERGLADGVVVSGPRTARAVDRSDLEAAVAVRDELGRDVPVVVGSGVTPASVAGLLELADGAIVGTALKRGGETTNRVDPERVAALVTAARG